MKASELILAVLGCLGVLIPIFILISKKIKTTQGEWPSLSSGYSPEIDGLRAIAVMSVIFYHFNIPFFDGGYTGVDVFFVISGYLITRMICKDLADGNFSFKTFYSRRTRRIFPALIVTLAATVILGFIVLQPERFLSYGGSLVASSFFVSNWYFLGEAGYFNADAITKPLLHTWSLGIEEQFYLIFPLVLFICHRYFSFVATATLVLLLAMLSFSGSQLRLGFDQTGAFYISPYRFFEFGFGATLVFFTESIRHRTLLNALSLSGFVLVLFPVYKHPALFPGVYALPTCLGAALLIYARSSDICKVVLGNRAMVWIGVLSYSLYLVHWPLVVFYKQARVQVGPLEGIEQTTLLAMTCTMAYMLHRFVETPFRKVSPRSWFGMSPVLFFCFTGLSATAIAGMAIKVGNGWPSRFPDLQLHFATPLSEHHKYVWARFKKTVNSDFVDNGKPKVLIVGDSQAADFLNVLSSANDHLLDVSTMLLHNTCQAVIPEDELFYTKIDADKEKIRDCMNKHRNFSLDKRIEQADVIILGSSWRAYGVAEIEQTIRKLKAKAKVDVKILILGIKKQSRGGLDVLFLSRLWGYAPESVSFLARNTNIDTQNETIRIASREAMFLDLNRFVCDNSTKRCKVTTDNGDILFSDNVHLTKEGAIYIGRNLQESNLLYFLH